jgi:hypothetical protein
MASRESFVNFEVALITDGGGANLAANAESDVMTLPVALGLSIDNVATILASVQAPFGAGAAGGGLVLSRKKVGGANVFTVRNLSGAAITEGSILCCVAVLK